MPEAKQQRFDFSRGDQLGLLDAISLPGQPGVSGATAKSLLRAVDGFGARCFASTETLGQRIDRTERTTHRALRYLEQLGLIVPDDDKRKHYLGAATKNRRIDWTELERYVARQRIMTPCHDTVSAHHDMVSEHHDTVSAHHDMVSEHHDMVSPKPSITERTAPKRLEPELNRAAAVSFDSVSESDWEPVREVLHQSGLDRTLVAIRAAKEQGMAPVQVLEIVREYDLNRSKFRSPGAIVDRIRHGAWCAALPTPETREKVKASREAQRREFARQALCREWKAAKVWHLKTDADIEAELDRRLMLATSAASKVSP